MRGAPQFFTESFSESLIPRLLRSMRASVRVFRGLKTIKKVRTACSLCMNYCGLYAYVEDGTVVKLEGDPKNPRNRGHLCAKGLSGFLNAYSPKRITKPLIRTNKEKGLNVDPKWKEISWDEAFQIVSDKVRDALAKTELEAGERLRRRPTGPDFHIGSLQANRWSQRIIVDTFDLWSHHSGVQLAWIRAANAFRCVLSAECYCGNAVHPPSHLNTATFEVTVDPEYSKYILLVGAQAGSIIHYDTMNVARHIAENRPGGIKVVVVDPMAGYAASKAEEWVPIRPGTDAAFLLGITNLLLNEYGIYDVKFLKEKTNGPYLVGEDGHYVRSKTSGKPLVWDQAEGRPKEFDDPAVRDYALEGVFLVDGRSSRPSFEIVKTHLKKYTPELVSEITTIPQDTLRRLAREIGEAACIGKTITIDGQELPYRPFSMAWYRGFSAHRHSFIAGLAAILLPTVLGAIQVPGGVRGEPGYPEYVTKDGLMAPETELGSPYPPREVSKPTRVDAYELFPVSVYSTQIIPALLNYPERFGIDMKDFVWPDVMFIWRDNAVKNTYSPEMVARGLGKIPFIVSFCIELDETANALADIVFPDTHHLEKLSWELYLRIDEPGYWYCAKPAVKPPFESPWDNLVNTDQILLEIAKRAGFLRDVYDALNEGWKLKGTPNELDPGGDYTYQELGDRRLKSWLGPDKGSEWLMSDEGGLLVWGAKPDEKYKGAFRKGRIHVYFEFMLNAKEQLDKVVKELGVRWDTSDYQPLPDWKPCPAYTKRDNNYNLFLINYKNPVTAHSVGITNPMAKQLLSSRGHLDSVLIHPQTAAGFGIREGDEIIVENWKGTKQRGIAHLTERIHPETIAASQHKLKKGINFNFLVVLDDDTLDYVGGAIDACLLVKVCKLEG